MKLLPVEVILGRHFINRPHKMTYGGISWIYRESNKLLIDHGILGFERPHSLCSCQFLGSLILLEAR